MFIETGSLQPYVLAGISAVLAWFCKTVIDQGKLIVRLETSFKIYLDSASKGAALLLNRPNPTPDYIRPLLHQYVEGTLADEDRQRLLAWAKSVALDEDCDNEERAIAYQLAGAVGAQKKISQGKRHWWTSWFK